MVRRSRGPAGVAVPGGRELEIHYPHSGFGYIVAQSLEPEHAMG
jgi:hypothetical protein